MKFLAPTNILSIESFEYSLKQVPTYFKKCQQAMEILKNACYKDYGQENADSADAPPFCVDPNFFHNSYIHSEYA